MEFPEESASLQAPPQTLSASEIVAMLAVQRKLIAAFVGIVVLVTLAGSLLVQKQYRSTATIQISSRAGQELRVEDVVDYDRLSQERTYTKTQIDLLKSRGLREEVVRRFEALGFDGLSLEGNGAKKLEKRMKVVQRRDTELVDVSVTDTDPERAARLANLIAEVYREQTLDGRRDSAREAKVWLQQQLTDYKQRIVDESQALIAYQKDRDLADAEEEITRLSATMDALNKAYGEVSTERVLLATTVEGHERLLRKSEFESLAKDMKTPLIVALAEEYSAAVTENAQVTARYLEKMPERTLSDAKVQGIREELRREVQRTLTAEKAQLDILRAKENSLGGEIDGAKARLLERQSQYGEYERLKMKLDRSKQFYEKLSQRDSELDLASRTQLSNARVIDEARPESKPVGPNILYNVVIAVVLGIAFGAVIGFVVEYVDDTISSPLDVATYLHLPFLGVVPHLVKAKDDRARALYTHEQRSSPPSEAVRTIRTVLDLNPTTRMTRRFLVTSSHSSEGKTNTVVNLAVSFAILGRRVLIVDADMRRPRLHDIFDLGDGEGLSSVLRGGSVDRAIAPTCVERLDVLRAGPSNEGPNELLASAEMSNLLEDLDGRYDVILVDTAPSGILSDAAILSRLVDGVVFVVREKTISRWHVRDAVLRLQQVGAKVLGVVVNDVKTGRQSRYRYYYDYRYRYHDEDEPGVAAK